MSVIKCYEFMKLIEYFLSLLLCRSPKLQLILWYWTFEMQLEFNSRALQTFALLILYSLPKCIFKFSSHSDRSFDHEKWWRRRFSKTSSSWFTAAIYCPLHPNTAPQQVLRTMCGSISEQQPSQVLLLRNCFTIFADFYRCVELSCDSPMRRVT